MEDNPFSAFAQKLNRTDRGLIVRRGVIKSVTSLSIDVGGITANGRELMVNSALLEHEECFILTGDEPSSFEAKVTPKFSVGDTVLLLTEDDQLFYVLCKVVSA